MPSWNPPPRNPEPGMGTTGTPQSRLQTPPTSSPMVWTTHVERTKMAEGSPTFASLMQFARAPSPPKITPASSRFDERIRQRFGVS